MLAFLYAGQGSQKVGMGKDLYEQNEVFRNVIDQIDLDIDLKRLMFEGPLEELTQTKNTQPCLAAFAAGVTAVLKSEGIVPDYVAGLSLGEHSALHCAGVFDFNTLIKEVAFRGEAMEKAGEGIEFKMSAVIGLDSKTLEDICAEVATDDKYVIVSNYNSTGQYAICGDEDAVTEVENIAKEKGARRCIQLNVSGPFHTKYMTPAAEALDKFFDNVTFNEMEIPVVFNKTASTIADGETVRELVVSQVNHSIHMEETIKFLKEKGVDTIVEVGPGKALSGFVKKTVDGMTVYNIENVDGLQKAIDGLKNN